jgi:hypothetical protein
MYMDIMKPKMIRASLSHVTICYDLELSVEKSVKTSYTMTHNWNVTKTVTPTLLQLFTSQSDVFDWDITVTELPLSYSDFVAVYTVTVHNPTSSTATGLSLADALFPPAAEHNCDTLTSVNANSSATCSYTVTYNLTAPGDTGYPNTVTLSDATGELDRATASAIFNAANATVTEIDETYSLTDEYTAPGGVPTEVQPLDKQTVTCDTDEGEHSNTVTLVGDDSGLELDTATATATLECYNLTVSKTAAGSYSNDFKWSITKSVNPTTVDLAAGASQNFTWTITLTKELEAIVSETVTGEITIVNSHPSLSMGVTLSDSLSIAGTATINYASCDNGASFADPVLTVQPGTTKCSYSVAADFGAVVNVPNDVTNTVTMSFPTLNLDAATFTTPAIVWTAGTPVNDSVTLDDVGAAIGEVPSGWTNITPNPDGAYSSSTNLQYTGTYQCSTTASDYGADYAYTAQYRNTATISGDDGIDDSAGPVTATVNCTTPPPPPSLPPTVTKTAYTSFIRQYRWDIYKTGDRSSLTLTPGQTRWVNYMVRVIKLEPIDSNWTVYGHITVTNPNATPMTVTVADSLAGAVIDCGDGPGDTELTIPANSSAACSYTAARTNNYSGKNIARVTWNGNVYTAKRYFRFGSPTERIDECVVVTDDHYGVLGTRCRGDGLSRTFYYRYLVGSDGECNTNDTFVNIARLDTVDDANDTDFFDTDDHVVNIRIRCDDCPPTHHGDSYRSSGSSGSTTCCPTSSGRGEHRSSGSSSSTTCCPTSSGRGEHRSSGSSSSTTCCSTKKGGHHTSSTGGYGCR